MTSNDEPIKRTNLQTAITKEILLRIVEKRYPIGAKLPPERDMAQDLDVSRPTLRQALSLLRSLGVLTVKHGSGSFVNDPQTVEMPESLRAEVFGLDIDSLGDLLLARNAVETAAAGLAAQRRTDDHLSEMRGLQEIMRDHLFDTAPFVDANARFHQLIAYASGNRYLADAADRLTDKLRLYMVATTYVAHRHKQTLSQHDKIIEALAARDTKASERAVRTHLTSVEKQSETRSRTR